MIKCPGCQKELPDGAKFCTSCGMTIKTQAPANNANQPKPNELPGTAPQPQAQNHIPPKTPQSSGPRMESLPPQNTANSQFNQGIPNGQPTGQNGTGAPHGQPAGQNSSNGYKAPPPFYGQNQTPPPYHGQPQYQQPYGMPYNMGDNTPLGVVQYIIMMILQAIPLVGLIAMIIWAIGGQGSNVNRRNYARAYLVIQLISIVISILFGIIFAAFMPAVIQILEEISYSMI